MDIAAIAARQHGAVSRRQLREAGLSDRQIAHRVATGRLHRVHHGVYALGHPRLAPLGRAHAAVLACDGRAVVSHRAAAAIAALLAHPPIVSVTTPRDGSRPRGVDVHRVTGLPPSHRARRNGLWVTTVARTLLDLAATEPVALVSQVLGDAHAHRLVSTAVLTAFLDTQPGRPGAPALRELLEGGNPTRSPLEDRFFALLRAARLPPPLVNVRINGHRVDFAWPEQRVIVETDGWASHGSRTAFEGDRGRDLDHHAAGWHVARITRRMLRREPHAVTARLGALLLGSTG